MSSDRQDRDGVPLPTGPLEEPAVGEVVSLRPSARRVLPAAELAVSSFGEVAARVAAAGEPRWLIQGLWPADAYGVLAAQEKAGKTWAALDLAVSVAIGLPWLDHFACPTPGPVLVFLGEGGERATVRRIEASPPVNASPSTSWPTSCGSASACPGWPPLAPAGSLPPSRPSSKPTRPPWSSLTRCTWPRPGPADRTCTTWARSSRLFKGSARQPGARCWW
jgi:AAA domain